MSRRRPIWHCVWVNHDTAESRAFHIVDLAYDRRDAEPGTLVTAFAAIEQIFRADDLARYGNDDQTEPAEVMLDSHRANEQADQIWLLAVRGEPSADLAPGRHGFAELGPRATLDQADVVGVAQASLPLLDNLKLLNDGTIHVREDWRRRGVGRALALAFEDVARRAGRSILMGWLDSMPSDAPDALQPSEGDFRIARDAGPQFAITMGYQLAQAERHSVQELTGRVFDQPAVAPGYRIETWRGPTPERRLSHVATMQRDMSTDPPLGELAFEEEVWDADRVRNHEKLLFGTRDAIVSLAIHEQTDAAAGYSQLYRMVAKPQVVDQWNTLVAREHRGHGLGLALKLANLAQVARWWPDAQRVHTWNAAENDHMWQINEQLGYRVVSIDSGWQKRLVD